MSVKWRDFLFLWIKQISFFEESEIYRYKTEIMKISFDWLKQHIDIEEPVTTIAEKLTKSGLEVEGVEEQESIKGSLEGLVIGEVLTCIKHPDADKLLVSKINTGDKVRQIVSGISKHYRPEELIGKKVIVVKNLKPVKLSGVLSEGMLLAGKNEDNLEVLEVSKLKADLLKAEQEIQTSENNVRQAEESLSQAQNESKSE